jgi:hypothetical protein
MPRILLVLAFMLLLSAPASAQVAGAACTELGASVMAANQMEIVACLKDTAGKLYWKSMTSSGGSSGSICGWVHITSVRDSCYDSDCGAGWDITTYTPNDLQKCEGKTVATLVKDRWGAYTGAVTTSCPTGYTVRSMSFTSGNYGIRDYFCGKN